MTSPVQKKSSSSGNKTKTIKVLILGQSGVGKTALVVRFITRRFIGEYASVGKSLYRRSLQATANSHPYQYAFYSEQNYSYLVDVDGDIVNFDIFDTAGGEVGSSLRIQENIRWADAYVLVYSTTDSQSFEECMRFKFLINHFSTRKFNLGGGALEPVVILIGNKSDLEYDRMVSYEQANKRSHDLACLKFFEMSARESVDDIREAFRELYVIYRARKGTRTGLFRSASTRSRKTSSPDDYGRTSSNGSLSSTDDEGSGSEMMGPRSRFASVGRRFGWMIPTFTRQRSSDSFGKGSDEDIFKNSKL
ncbi:ras-related and estrogen-regulated growth inhibitor-like [Lineus longissimus]|uniref:ras-related and estrogen-regulated growth inhibitor-like n=1 Tax=Lineus longissimus TaxID=88925 RepID=UPI00315CB261